MNDRFRHMLYFAIFLIGVITVLFALENYKYAVPLGLAGFALMGFAARWTILLWNDNYLNRKYYDEGTRD